MSPRAAAGEGRAPNKKAINIPVFQKLKRPQILILDNVYCAAGPDLTCLIFIVLRSQSRGFARSRCDCVRETCVGISSSRVEKPAGQSGNVRTKGHRVVAISLESRNNRFTRRNADNGSPLAYNCTSVLRSVRHRPRLRPRRSIRRNRCLQRFISFGASRAIDCPLLLLLLTRAHFVARCSSSSSFPSPDATHERTHLRGRAFSAHAALPRGSAVPRSLSGARRVPARVGSPD